MRGDRGKLGAGVVITTMSYRPQIVHVASLLMALAVVAQSAHATFPGANGLLSVSYSFRCPGRQVATLSLDGRRLRMLTPRVCSFIDRGPWLASWSADGRRLIFEYLPADPADDPRRFAIINADGSGRRDVPLEP